MSAWKTVRVRADLLERVRARAEQEGTNATAWTAWALGAALGEPTGGGRPSEAGEQAGSTPAPSASAPRRASKPGLPVRLASSMVRSSADAKRGVKPIPRGAGKS